MPSKYDLKDQKLVESVTNALNDRMIININENGESMVYPPPVEDPIFPQVALSHEEIKQETGRDKLRKNAVDNLKKLFFQKNFEVFDDENAQAIIIKTKTYKDPKRTDFKSFKSLTEANTKTKREYEESIDKYKAAGENPENFNPLRDPLE
jgi:hypothetical protein